MEGIRVAFHEPIQQLDRRRLILGAGGFSLLGLGGCATTAAAPLPSARALSLPPLRASIDRIFDITVCTRPFRAAGPRLDVERVGDTLVVHNYGHGGSGWSLSWGSSTLAVQKAMVTSPREIAVIGCGALGLTSALLAQEAGAAVTIYARDRIPETRSVRATGSWTPDSRIALEDAAAPGFAELWEQMARTSFRTYRRYLGLPGTPVEWIDQYNLSDGPSVRPSPAPAVSSPAIPRLHFAEYRARIADLTPRSEVLAPGSTPFPVANVRRSSHMIFNIANLSHTLFNDFLLAGGKFQRMEFRSPADIAALKEKVVINCPGYGARALWRDESIVPVRGQMNWLVPQADFHYGLYYRQVGVTPRRDGIGVQMLDGGDMKGYGIEDETPDRAEAERAVGILAELSARMAGR
jgi:hypothetical protein